MCVETWEHGRGRLPYGGLVWFSKRVKGRKEALKVDEA